MTKVCIFSNEDRIEFQQTINEFIQDKHVIDIKYQTFVLPKKYIGPAVCESAIIDRALVIYEAKDYE